MNNAGNKKTKDDYFKSKWILVDEKKREEILNYALDHSANMAGLKYYKELEMHPGTISTILRRIIMEKGLQSRYRGGTKKVFPDPDAPKEIRLTPKEKDLLRRLEQGTATMDEVERMVAVKVFEKMFKNPDQFKFYDFYQSQLIKIKRQEVEDRNNQAMEIINRLFMGKIPPQICPNCGERLYDTAENHIEDKKLILEEGEVIEDGTKITSRKI